MFHLSINLPLLRYSMPTMRERRTYHSTLTHLPTGRKWHFASKRAGLAAMAAMTAAVKEGRLSILPAMEAAA